MLPELPDPDRGFAELWDHFRRPESWTVFSDVAPALQALSEAGFRVRIASNFDGRLRDVVRGLADLEPWSTPLIISSEIGYRKPHPAFYQAACESLGLPPSQVLCLGDDVENDVQGPSRAGLRALLIDRAGRTPHDVPFLPDLNALAERLIGRLAWADRSDRTVAE